jgi:hypothetical protein
MLMPPGFERLLTIDPHPDYAARRAEVGTRNLFAELETVLNARCVGHPMTPEMIADMQAIVDRALLDVRSLGETLVNEDGREIVGVRFFKEPGFGRVVLVPLIGERVGFWTPPTHT